jgi:hypothetical protein
MGNGPCVLVDAPALPPLVVPPLLVVPSLSVTTLPLAFLFPLAKLMPRVVVALLGAAIPLVIET